MSKETTWKSQAGFVWSLIGSAVGFANILSFSAKAYKNGGGAYLIPYALAVLLVGIPFLILEGKIGNWFQAPLVRAYGLVWGRLGKTLGWLSVLACMTIGAFYIVLTGYSVAYTFFAAGNLIPDDTKTFFLKDFLHISPSLKNAGIFSWPIFAATLGVAAVSWYVLRKTVREGIEKVCSFFMPLMVVLISLFAIVVTFLPGGMQGWVYYLKPNFEKLLSINLWCDVFGQLFFSLSLGLGIIVGYSRHSKENTNILKAMSLVALGDFCVSFIAGAAIFGVLAHISHTQHIPFDQILTSDSTFEIGFILFPKILKAFGPVLAQWIGTLFFFCVFIAGITGVFSIIESIAGNLEVELKTTRKKAVSATLLVTLFLSLFFCMGNASHLIDSLAPMVLGTNMLIGGLALSLAFGMNPKSLFITHKFPKFCLKVIAPFILTVILAGSLWQEYSHFDLASGVRWSWFVVAIAASLLLTFAEKKKEAMITG
ncbi:MAG TPA: sodium-dependent transporter [Chlamydiales bacterium]|nr:sodium-dependent transporter [Chlamydiales bacterium]